MGLFIPEELWTIAWVFKRYITINDYFNSCSFLEIIFRQKKNFGCFFAWCFLRRYVAFSQFLTQRPRFGICCTWKDYLNFDLAFFEFWFCSRENSIRVSKISSFSNNSKTKSEFKILLDEKFYFLLSYNESKFQLSEFKTDEVKFKKPNLTHIRKYRNEHSRHNFGLIMPVFRSFDRLHKASCTIVLVPTGQGGTSFIWQIVWNANWKIRFSSFFNICNSRVYRQIGMGLGLF